MVSLHVSGFFAAESFHLEGKETLDKAEHWTEPPIMPQRDQSNKSVAAGILLPSGATAFDYSGLFAASTVG